MKKTYYLFNPGRLSRKDNTLKFTPVNEDGEEGMAKYLPIENVENLMVFGSLDANSALYNFLGKHKVRVHFFDYYEHYCGSFMPKDYLLAGKMQILQTQAYLNPEKRSVLARKFVEGAAANMIRNLRYYQNRGKDLIAHIQKIEELRQCLHQPANLTKGSSKCIAPTDIPELMGIEGNIRQIYYQAFDTIIPDYPMQNRTKQPPENEVNALISFGNMICYTLCLDQIYHTQLNPTISFLHEPGTRRYSLALDLAEVFKPILVDRMIFKLLNQNQIQGKHFDYQAKACFLKDSGRKILLKEWDQRLSETIKHRSLGKKVSYKTLVKLECYKLAKDLLGITPYEPFKIWW